jgi:hypothetical protein
VIEEANNNPKHPRFLLLSSGERAITSYFKVVDLMLQGYIKDYAF